MSILNKGEGTSPLERDILTHFWTRPTEYKGDRTAWTELDHRIVIRFLELGLLKTANAVRSDANGFTYLRIEGVREALEPYMRALAAVPLPVQTWVVP